MAFFSRTTWQAGTILDFNETRDDGVAMKLAGPCSNHLYLL